MIVSKKVERASSGLRQRSGDTGLRAKLGHDGEVGPRWRKGVSPFADLALRKRDGIAEKPSERALVASARRSRECPDASVHLIRRRCYGDDAFGPAKIAHPLHQADEREGPSNNTNKAKNGHGNPGRVADQASAAPDKCLMS
jgi:hypothetical protein